MEAARKFNLFSDVFMTVALQDVPACQHVLRILTGVQDLKVTEVRTQVNLAKITSHNARLDVLAEDSGGKVYNIEVQRRDTVDHARRARFYSAMIDSAFLEKGEEYDTLPEVYIIYISETDLWQAGKTRYPVVKYLGDTGIPYEDGIHILYVNAAVNDGTETAKLMDYFKRADPSDKSQGELSQRIHFLKCEEGGNESMCEIAESFVREGIELGRQQGMRQGVRQGAQQGELKKAREIAKTLCGMGWTTESIAKTVQYSTEQVASWLKEEN